jgi:hypothetical protein
VRAHGVVGNVQLVGELRSGVRHELDGVP